MSGEDYKPEWLDSLEEGCHACFFYTTQDEFFEITAQYLEEGFSLAKERVLWVLPPHLSIFIAKTRLEERMDKTLDAYIQMRRLILMPWENWYGKEISTQELLTLGRRILKITLKEGFEQLRILTHAPAKSSPYWKDFLALNEALSRKQNKGGYTIFCAYSLIDCPVVAIPLIAENHQLCLMHHGSDWEWFSESESPSISTSNRLLSRGFSDKAVRR